MKKNLVVILGPTASGKTALAVRLAADLCGEIISADSRQVYRGMDIGTGKDLSEYQTEKGKIPVHLIDIIKPEQEFNVFKFQKRFYEIFTALHNKQVLPVLVGGTGLYLESVLTDYDLPAALPDERLRDEMAGKTQAELQEILLALKPALHNRTDLDDRDRLIRKIEIEKARQTSSGELQAKPFVNAGIFGIHWERDVLRRRIAQRLAKRIDEGMIEEVSRLRSQGLSWERLDSFGLEYRYVAMYLQHKMTIEEMTSKLQIAIGQFAKRQMTWFRRMEKKGVKIEWVSGDNYSDLHRRVLKVLS
ncbi:MAG: tRNA (adenosine(37)-N6)-dimethylallyltransferase MiaA [Deltaproteobacteria bacterium HGW-Deltaproteobacteria-1]|jgi:tRNA dimethylallyltransferase|nr:MAG: tRNA (adenosine(37)-N6)-dimethylallyltransferase MiaA [Deltaproteobacteria bacterium HGW-Deltaproteobacteria-1]